MLIQKPYIGVIGEGGYKWYNAASMDNSGVEATFTWRDEIKDFKYDISFNISYYKNEITELPDVIKYTWEVVTVWTKPLWDNLMAHGCHIKPMVYSKQSKRYMNI